jgi:hypothetical protein
MDESRSGEISAWQGLMLFLYPRTTGGHVVAAVLMIAGIALFSTFTATVASLFVQQDSRREGDKADEILRKLDALSERLERMEKPRTDQPPPGPPSS